MIAITSENGELLKAVPWEDGKVIGYNRLFGFVSEAAFVERHQNRLRHGFKSDLDTFDFQFCLGGGGDQNLILKNAQNCTLERIGNTWQLKGTGYNFQVQDLAKIDKLPVEVTPEEEEKNPWIALLLLALLPALFLFFPRPESEDLPVIIEQVTVQIKPEMQKPVEISTPLERLPEVQKQAQVAKRAIQQNLGFLGLLGRKDLKKAVGGVPTDLKDVSPGAGPGGKEGSGGELLVGLGQGLKRTTIGNTGVAGLGGVGTHGSGGGAGGYGNAAIGSGEGKALSALPLAQELVLEGGLDRSVVQATIAKYLNQVRACYETGLKRNPGLSGQVTMNFEIGGAGDLNFARVNKSSLDDKDVEQCIATRMMGWKFPKPRGGVSVKVSYPFVLRSTLS